MEREKIENIAETIIRDAAQSGTAVAYNPPADFTTEEWREVKETLSAYGNVAVINKDGGVRFLINEKGKLFAASGGYQNVRKERMLREREVIAIEKDAEASRKAKNCALWADIIALFALAVSIVALIRGW